MTTAELHKQYIMPPQIPHPGYYLQSSEISLNRAKLNIMLLCQCDGSRYTAQKGLLKRVLVNAVSMLFLLL